MPLTYSKLLTIALMSVMLLACAGKSARPVSSISVQSKAIERPVFTPEVLAEYKASVEELKAGNIETAKRRFSKLVKVYPLMAGAEVNLGIIADLQQDKTVANAHFDRALKANPSNLDALIYSASYQQEAGLFAAAEQHLLKAEQIAPNSDIVQYNLGVLYELYLQEYERAVEHYQRYVELSQSDDTEKVKRWIKLLERK